MLVHCRGYLRDWEQGLNGWLEHWGFFIEELSFIACFPNPLTHRHTPGIGSGCSQAERLAGQDLLLHRPLIPCKIFDWGAESTHSQTSYLEKVQPYFFLLASAVLSHSPSSQWWLVLRGWGSCVVELIMLWRLYFVFTQVCVFVCVWERRIKWIAPRIFILCS